MSSLSSYSKLPPITNKLDNDDDASASQVTDRCVSQSSCLSDTGVDVNDIVYNLNVSETHDLTGPGIQPETSRESRLDSSDLKIQYCESVSASHKIERETPPTDLNEDIKDISTVDDGLEEEKEGITNLDRRDPENVVVRCKSISEILKNYEDDDDFNLLSSNEEEEQRQRDLEFKQRQRDLSVSKANSEKRKTLYVSKMAELTERWNGVESRLENRHTERRQQIYKQLLQIISDYKH